MPLNPIRENSWRLADVFAFVSLCVSFVSFV